GGAVPPRDPPRVAGASAEMLTAGEPRIGAAHVEDDDAARSRGEYSLRAALSTSVGPWEDREALIYENARALNRC
ncbi:MAG: hypothetical protein ACXVQY_10220, partial [Actinomycetota bacterium]